MPTKNLYEKFQNPDQRFQPANYWFWQYIPTHKEIDTQLTEMQAAGFSTFFIQPRLAFPIELYMSDEYLAAYKYAIQRAHAMGLRAGIYDDYNWNSGHAGGLTVKGHNELRERQLFWTSTNIHGTSATLEVSEITTLMGDTLGGPQGQWTYEGGKALWTDWQIIRVLAYQPDQELKINDRFEDLSGYCSVEVNGEKSCTIAIHLPNNDYSGLKLTVFVAARSKTSRHINYLDTSATQRFIEVGYEPYKKAVGEYFGSTIFCMFMDHPHAGFYAWKQNEGNVNNTLMFDESLIKAFEEEHSYPIENAWLSFLLPESALTSKLRGDFFNTYGSMARDKFLGQVSEWAHKNGLKFAGHELFGFLGIMGFYGGYHVVDQRTDFGGDYFGIGSYKDISTVDAYNSDPQIDAKVGDSVARLNGSHGCMLEQYYFNVDPQFPGAIGHWNLTYEEMRAQAMRHTFFGMSQFIFHGFYLSDHVGGNALLASSKYDFAPAINFQPWFKHFDVFAKEISHLSAFIYQSEPITEIGLLYPLSTFWAEGTDGVFGEESAVWNQVMLEHGLGFDILDETRLTYDPATPGRIHCGKNSYRVLLLPGVKVLINLQEAYDISNFVRSGGKLILSGAVPHLTVENGSDKQVEEIFAQIISNKTNVVVIDRAGERKARLVSLLEGFLPEIPTFRKLDDTPGTLWSWAGREDNFYSIALFNDSGESTRVKVQIPIKHAKAEYWQTLTAEREPWSWFEEKGNLTFVYISLEAQQTACFRVMPAQEDSKLHLVESSLTVLGAGLPHLKLQAESAGSYEITLANSAESVKKGFEIPEFPQVITLNGEWRLSFAGEKSSRLTSLATGWEQQGFADLAGEGSYETIFDMPANIDWENWDWRIEFPQLISSAEIILNDRLAGKLLWAPYKLILPASLLVPSNNHLMVKVTNTAGNYYYSDSPYQVKKFPSGLIGAPKLIPVKTIIV